MGIPVEEAFDRLTRLASEVLDVPIVLVSLVEKDRQFFKSCLGLPEPWVSERETPLSHSFYQHVVGSGKPLVIADARKHPLVRENLAIRDLDVIAYAGIPLATTGGHVLGSFCVIDHKPRSWTEREIGILRQFAASVMTEIELRAARADLERRVEGRTAELAQREAHFRALLEHASDMVSVLDAEGVQNPGLVRYTEYRFRHKDGRWRVLESTGSNALESPAVRGVIVNSRDVSERAELEAELETQRAFLRAVIDCVLW